MAESKFDFKKEYKSMYLQKTAPVLVDVLPMTYLCVDGKGDPNTSGEYKDALAVLYGLSYTIKMSKMDGSQPQGYFDYVVPPLEGLWWMENREGFDGIHITDKSRFLWTSMIGLPSFVNSQVLEQAKEKLHKKNPALDLSRARMETLTEGLCAQIMHLGSYDEEPDTIRRMQAFLEAEGYITDINETRKHHEIYFNDPRKTAPEKLKTIIRHPVKIRI